METLSPYITEVPSNNHSNPQLALSLAALHLIKEQTTELGNRTPAADQALVAATIGDYVVAQEQIDRLRRVLSDPATKPKPDVPRTEQQKLARTQTKQELFSYKTRAAQFNHILRQMIDSSPDTPYSEVRDFLYQAYKRFNPNYDKHTFPTIAGQLESVLQGMASEIYTQQLAVANGLFFRDSSLEQDLGGTDYFIEIGDELWPVDAKSTLEAAVAARQNDTQGKHLVLSAATTPGEQLKPMELGLRLSPEQIEIRKETFFLQVALELQRVTTARAKQAELSKIASEQTTAQVADAMAAS